MNLKYWIFLSEGATSSLNSLLLIPKAVLMVEKTMGAKTVNLMSPSHWRISAPE